MKKLINFINNPKAFLLVVLNHLAPWIINDETFIKLKWRLRMNYPLNLKYPQTFNEKLQWLKLHDRKPIYTTMVDKYEAKKYVADIIGEEHIIPTLSVYERVEDIDFDALPDQFVLKCTHDSGGLVICRDKSNLDKAVSYDKLRKSLKRRYFWQNREWPYKNVKPRIIAEKYMEDSTKRTHVAETKSLTDYKFYCFNGEAKYLYVSSGLENHSTARISFLTMDWQFAPFGRSDYAPFEILPEQPSHFEEMVRIANHLSEGHAFLRVDMYEINGQIYFSELTFHPCSGMMPFNPQEWDEKLGNLISLS